MTLRSELLAICRRSNCEAILQTIQGVNGVRGSVKLIEGDRAVAILVPTAPSLPMLPGRAGRSIRKHIATRAVGRLRLLEALHGVSDVLPAVPGQKLNRRQAAIFLSGNATRLDEMLASAAGMEEWQVTIDWDTASVLSHFKDAPELAPALAGNSVAPDALARGVAVLRARLSHDFMQILDPILSAAELLPPQDADTTVLSAAIMTGRRSRAALDTALARIDATWTDGLRLRIIGPYPPATFRGISIRMATASEVAQATKLLGAGADWRSADLRQLRRHALRDTHPESSGHTREPSAATIGKAYDLLSDLGNCTAGDVDAALRGNGFPLASTIRQTGQTSAPAPNISRSAA